MLDKELIKSKFQKSILTYSDNAPIQKQIAHKLASYIQGEYDNVLEIGSYSGFLTQEIIKKVNFKNYSALDIVDSFDFIKDLSSKIRFIKGDIEDIELNSKFDLIVSSSTLQWCEDFSGVIKKIQSYLNEDGKLAIAIFGNKNLFEIKETFDVSLNYPDISEVKKYFSDNAIIFEEIQTIEFQNPAELLRHLKYTGVNAFNHNYTYSKIKENMRLLDKKYKNKLTYNPLYIID